MGNDNEDKTNGEKSKSDETKNENKENDKQKFSPRKKRERNTVSYDENYADEYEEHNNNNNKPAKRKYTKKPKEKPVTPKSFITDVNLQDILNQHNNDTNDSIESVSLDSRSTTSPSLNIHHTPSEGIADDDSPSPKRTKKKFFKTNNTSIFEK